MKKEVVKIKIKQVSYERLESDPYGFHNTRIGMVAELEEKDNPLLVLDDLKRNVDETHKFYKDNRINHKKLEVLTRKAKLQYNRLKTLLHKSSTPDELIQIKKMIDTYSDMQDEMNELRQGINHYIQSRSLLEIP